MPVGGEISEDDVMALFDEDGDMRDEPQEDAEAPEAPAPEEESKEEESEEAGDESEENTEEEPEEEGEEPELDWSEVDPKIKSKFEEAQAEAEKWKKAHGKIQADWTKESRSRKETDSTLAELKSRDELLSRFEQLLDSNPDLYSALQAAARKQANPWSPESVPDYLRNDPMFNQFAGPMQQMQQQMQQYQQMFEQHQQQQQQAQEAQNKRVLDENLAAAGEKIKSMLGREATEEDLTRVLEAMVETQQYTKGAALAAVVFADEFEKAATKRAEAKLREKSQKFPVRNKAVNSRKVSTAPKFAQTPEEALAMAFAEQENK